MAASQLKSWRFYQAAGTLAKYKNTSNFPCMYLVLAAATMSVPLTIFEMKSLHLIESSTILLEYNRKVLEQKGQLKKYTIVLSLFCRVPWRQN